MVNIKQLPENLAHLLGNGPALLKGAVAGVITPETPHGVHDCANG